MAYLFIVNPQMETITCENLKHLIEVRTDFAYIVIHTQTVTYMMTETDLQVVKKCKYIQIKD